MLLEHIRTGVKFEHKGVFVYFNREVVELLNLKTGRIERFLNATYMQYFKAL